MDCSLLEIGGSDRFFSILSQVVELGQKKNKCFFLSWGVFKYDQKHSLEGIK